MTSPDRHPAAELSPPSSLASILLRHALIIILIFLAAIISLHITVGEFHFNGDEMRHAVSGAFFRDAIVDHPWHHPFRYVRQYYAKYPALGIPHWPPLFYFVEGIFFLVFGFSVWASRLCVLCYALLAAYFWYRIAERQGPRHLALLSTLIYPLLPFLMLYQRAAMLEVPLLALSFGAIHYWLCFVEHEKPLDIWLVGFFSAAAFLTSQKAMFLPVFLGLHFLVLRPFRLLKQWHFWAALAAAGMAVAPWYLLSLGTLSLSYERVVGHSFEHLTSYGTRTYTFYIGALQEQLRVGWMILGLAGFCWALLRQPKKRWFLLLWVVTCYGAFTLIQERDVRHTMVWIPVFIYFGLLVVDEMFTYAGARRWVWVAFALLFGYTLFKGLTIDRPRYWGVEDAARYVSQLPEADIVYYQGHLNGDFIFYFRKYDPQKRRMVAREKQAVATKIVEGYGTRVIMNTPEEVLTFFRTWGIRYALIENQESLENLGPMSSVLHSDAFEMMRSFPMHSSKTLASGWHITLYRYRGALQRTDELVTIPMMTLRKDISVKLDNLVGRPWPH